MNRRDFIALASTSSVGLGLGFSWQSQVKPLASESIIIKSIEVYQFEKSYFILTTSTQGIEGISLCNTRMPYLVPMLKELVIPFFEGKDANQISTLVEDVYKVERNYKHAGMPFWNCVGHVEASILDLLGQVAQKPLHQLLGIQQRTQVEIYLSSLTRENSPAEEVSKLAKQIEKTGAKAIKLKIGGRMSAEEPVANRSKNIIKLARETFGEDFTIYADANGSYSVKEGIEMGKFLEDYQVAIYEEPCPWEDYAANQAVTKALKKIKLAGGEQDSSLFRFQDLAKERVYDILQPDLFYNGGLLRTLQVAKMAQAQGLSVAPHSPKSNPLIMPFLHFAALAPNLYGFQEYPATANKDKFPDWYSPHVFPKEGVIEIPQGTGLGTVYDPEIWQKGKKI